MRPYCLFLPMLILISTAWVYPGLCSERNFGKYYYLCKPVKIPPVVDGSLADACWQGQTAISPFLYLGGKKEAEPARQTKAVVLFDKENIYLAAWCLTPDTSLVLTNCREDGGKVWRDESIEIFIDPFHEHSRNAQICVNTCGAIFAQDIENKQVHNAQRLLQTGVTKKDKEWNLEMKIPFRYLSERERPARVMGLNLVRNNVEGAGAKHSSWVLLPGQNSQQPVLFGHLIFADDETLNALRTDMENRIRNVQSAMAAWEKTLPQLGDIPQLQETRNVIQEAKRTFSEFKKLPNSFEEAKVFSELEDKLLKLESLVKEHQWRIKFTELFFKE